MEAVIDKRVRQVVEFGHNSETSLKAACLVAETVVGTYSGVTQEIAKRTRRSVSSVENWAHAARLYKELRGDPIYSFQARRLWRILPASHWWLAWDIHQKGYEAMEYLLRSDWHDWSGRAMMGEFDKDMQAGQAPLQFKRAVIAFRGLGDELLTKHRDQLTPRQAAALAEAKEAFTE